MNNTEVEKETVQAYCDCNPAVPSEVGYKNRNLNFRASAAVSRDEAFEIMEKAIVSGYNEFDADLIKKFPKDAEFVLAREGSVCLYVKGQKLPSAAKVKADEKSFNGSLTRYWWD